MLQGAALLLHLPQSWRDGSKIQQVSLFGKVSQNRHVFHVLAFMHICLKDNHSHACLSLTSLLKCLLTIKPLGIFFSQLPNIN